VRQLGVENIFLFYLLKYKSLSTVAFQISTIVTLSYFSVFILPCDIKLGLVLKQVNLMINLLI
jgi:hypothetical protein